MGSIDSIASDPLLARARARSRVLAVPIYATLDLMEKLSPSSALKSGHRFGQHKAQNHRCRGRLSTHRSARPSSQGHPWRARTCGAALAR